MAQVAEQQQLTQATSTYSGVRKFSEEVSTPNGQILNTMSHFTTKCSVSAKTSASTVLINEGNLKFRSS